MAAPAVIAGTSSPMRNGTRAIGVATACATTASAPASAVRRSAATAARITAGSARNRSARAAKRLAGTARDRCAAPAFQKPASAKSARRNTMQPHSMKMKTNARPWKPRRLLRRPRELRTRRQRRPRLRFSPTAWAKLLFVRDRGPTEVGGFGITVGGRSAVRRRHSDGETSLHVSLCRLRRRGRR